MKKSKHHLMQNLARKISEEEFNQNNSIHIFSEAYENNKKNILNDIKLKQNIKLARRKKAFIAVACIAVVCIPVSALAANKVINQYKMSKEQTDPYAYEYNIEEVSTDSSGEEPTKSELYYSNVKLQYGYFPDGYIESANQNNKFSMKGDYGNYNSAQNISICLRMVDEENNITVQNVLETKDMMINNNNASLIYKNFTDKNVFSKELLVYYNEYGYVLELFAQTEVSDDDILKIAQNLELVQCSKDESDVFIPAKILYKDTFKNDKSNNTTATVALTDTSAFDESTFLNIGDSFAGQSAYSPARYNSPNLTYTVKNVEIKDSIAGLDASSFSYNYNDVKQLVDASGILKPYVEKQIAKGNGKSSVDTIVGETTSNLKLVYVTMSVKNTTDNLVNQVSMIPTICCLKNTDGSLSAPASNYTTNAINSYGGWVYCDHPSMYDEDPSNTSAPKIRLQQIYSIKPQEEFTYHIAYIVDASKMNNMVLYFNSVDNKISPTSKEQTIIKLY